MSDVGEKHVFRQHHSTHYSQYFLLSLLFCMLCLCTLLFFRVCHVCPECVDTMPPKKAAGRVIPEQKEGGAYRHLEEHVVRPPSTNNVRGVGHSIRLRDIFHSFALMTRDLSWADVEVKKVIFLET